MKNEDLPLSSGPKMGSMVARPMPQNSRSAKTGHGFEGQLQQRPPKELLNSISANSCSSTRGLSESGGSEGSGFEESLDAAEGGAATTTSVVGSAGRFFLDSGWSMVAARCSLLVRILLQLLLSR